MSRNATLVCEIKCKNTEKAKEEIIQQRFKAKMQQHLREVGKLNKLDEKSALHTKCFTTQFPEAIPSSDTQVKAPCAVASGKATPLVLSKQSHQKAVPCVPKKELKF